MSLDEDREDFERLLRRERNPKNAFEAMALRAVTRRRNREDLARRRQLEAEAQGRTVDMFDPPPEVSQSDESEAEPASNSPEDLGFGKPPQTKKAGSFGGSSLDVGQRLELDRQVYGVSFEHRDSEGQRRRIDPTTIEQTPEGALHVRRCPSGWDDCTELDQAPADSQPLTDPWPDVVHLPDVAGLVRVGPFGRAVTRAWTPDGEPFALYDGRQLCRAGKHSVEAKGGFILADEPAAWLLQGRLPKDPVELPASTALCGWGVKNYPYSGVRNVLIAVDVRGLITGVTWAGKLAQLKRFGGMPVIAFPRGKPDVLRHIAWGERLILRVSDPTWELVKDCVPLEIAQRRRGLQ